jgi:hypothetical protein
MRLIIEARLEGAQTGATAAEATMVDVDHRALHGAGHGLCVLEAQTDQILGVSFDRCDVSAITRSGGDLNDQLLIEKGLADLKAERREGNIDNASGKRKFDCPGLKDIQVPIAPAKGDLQGRVQLGERSRFRRWPGVYMESNRILGVSIAQRRRVDPQL